MNKNFNIIPKIAKIIDEYELVLNKGSNDGIEDDMESEVYRQTEPIKDPDTGEVLECLYEYKEEAR